MSANDKQVGGTHYKRHDGAPEHWDWAADMPYLEARCTAYVARHQKKNGFADIERALHFLQKIAEVRYGIEVVVSYKPQGGHQVDPAWERSKQNPYANVTNE